MHLEVFIIKFLIHFIIKQINGFTTVVYTEIRNVSLKGYICFRIHADKLFEIKY
jgi:hypothetical protein